MKSKIKTSIDFAFAHFGRLPAERQAELAAVWWEASKAKSQAMPWLWEKCPGVTTQDKRVVSLPDSERDERRIVIVLPGSEPGVDAGWVTDVTVLARREACENFDRLMKVRDEYDAADELCSRVSGYKAKHFDYSPYHLSHGLARGYVTRPRGASMRGTTVEGHGVVLRSACVPGDVIVDDEGSRHLVVRNAALYGDARRIGWHSFESVKLDEYDNIDWL